MIRRQDGLPMSPLCEMISLQNKKTDYIGAWGWDPTSTDFSWALFLISVNDKNNNVLMNAFYVHVLWWYSFYMWRNWFIERLSNWPKFRPLISRRTGIQTQACFHSLSSNHSSLPLQERSVIQQRVLSWNQGTNLTMT